MRTLLHLLIFGFVLLLTACGTSAPEGDAAGNNGDNNSSTAPVLSAIGNRTILSGDPVTLDLSASDPNAGNLTWTADGTVGANNPFLAGAAFDESAHVFSWTDTSSALGSYSVRFSVTNDAVPPESDSETVTINVLDIYAYGENSYNTYCQSCHGSEGIGGMEQLVQCITETDLGIGMSRSPMSGIGAQWADYDREFSAIFYYLNNVQPQNC